MKIDEAIEILELNALEEGSYLPPRYITALKIGIEALKECIKARYGDPALDGELLPGETDE